jgi:hypothetical protein
MLYRKRNGAAGGGVGSEVVPIRTAPGYAEKEASRPHRIRPIGEIDYLERTKRRHIGGGVYPLIEVNDESTELFGEAMINHCVPPFGPSRHSRPSALTGLAGKI